MKFSKSWAAAAAMVALAGTAQASPMTLVDGGLGVLDSGTNLVWTANMNLNGQMSWAGATAWIAELNTSNYAGHNDWRLPTLNPSDTTCSSAGGNSSYGYNCTGGELGHLFITNLGNQAGESVLTQTGDTQTQKDNLALFSNVQSYYYWSGTEHLPDPNNAALYFLTNDGSQNFFNKSAGMYAVAVRPGDVAASVPEPQTLALALLALGATVVARRRRPA